MIWVHCPHINIDQGACSMQGSTLQSYLSCLILTEKADVVAEARGGVGGARQRINGGSGGGEGVEVRVSICRGRWQRGNSGDIVGCRRLGGGQRSSGGRRVREAAGGRWVGPEVVEPSVEML
jgi:hypothetical protein